MPGLIEKGVQGYQPKHSKETLDKAVELYLSGLSADKIQKQIGVSATHVYRLLEQRGIERRFLHSRPNKLTAKDLKEIEHLSAAGFRPQEIADRLGGKVNRESVSYWIRKMGFPRPRRWPVGQDHWHTLPEVTIQEGLRLFSEGMSIMEVAKQLGVHYQNLSNHLRKRGVRTDRVRTTHEERQRIARLFALGWDVKRIVEQTGRCRGYVSSFPKRYSGLIDYQRSEMVNKEIRRLYLLGDSALDAAHILEIDVAQVRKVYSEMATQGIFPNKQ